MRWLPTLAVLMAPAAHALPIELGHSGRVLDAEGAPVNGSTELTVRLYNDPVSTDLSAELHSETFTQSIQAGYFSVVLGADPTKELQHTVLDQPEVWVGVTVTGQSEMRPRMKLLSSPYAALARGLSAGAVAAGPIVLGPATPGFCTSETAGAIAYDGTLNVMVVCDGTAFRVIGQKTAVLVGGVYQWSDGSYGASCADYLNPQDADYVGSAADGVYRLEPVQGTVFDAYCDQGNGGWTLIMKTAAGSNLLRYDSGHWSASTALNPSSSGLDAGNAKLLSYSTLPVTSVRGCVTTPTSNCIEHTFSTPRTDSRAVFNGPASYEGVVRSQIEGIFGPSGQQNCAPAHHGFNIDGTDGARVRWGMTNNVPSQPCQSRADSDGVIGWGVQPQTGDCSTMGAGYTNYYVSDTACSGAQTSFNTWLWVK